MSKLVHSASDQENLRPEYLFGVLNEEHISNGSGGTDRMIEQFK